MKCIRFACFRPARYVIDLNTAGFPGSINIYSGKFFPATPAVNFFDTGVYDNAAGNLRYTNIYQPGDYDLVVSSTSSGQVGTFSGEITGPSNVEMLPRPTVPVFLNLPRDRTILTNTTATMSFSIEGAIPRTNQWYKGIPPDASMPIAGATGKSYTTPVLPSVGTNWHWVRVANSFGATTSGPVRVRVVDGPVQFAGKLRPGNKVFRKSNGTGGMEAGLSYYKTYFFEAPITGSYTCSIAGASVSVYNQIFLTNNPNVNLSMLPGSGNFTLNVAAPSTYIFVLSVPQGTSSAYSGTIVGPGGALVNELPAPAFSPQPAPTNQFLWRNEDPAPIIGNAIPVDSSWSWWRGVEPGLPADGMTSISNLTTRTNDQPASVTAQPTNLWFWARIDGAYGYDDSELCLLEVSPPPRFAIYPTNRSIVYGNLSNITTLVTNAPFALKWFQTNSPVQTNTVQTNVIQGYGATYLRSVQRTNTLPLLNVGTYSYWIQATNPSGATNGPTFTITVTKRPLFVSLTTPQGLTPYDGLPHGATATVTDLNPGGPPVPSPMRVDLTYQLIPGGVITTNPPINAGTYQVIGTVNHSNYMGSATNSYTIFKVALLARADNKFRTFGAANPPLSVTLSGFANGESVAVIDSLPNATTAATPTSPVGQYPITPSGGSDNNYSFTYSNGTLTVLGEPVVVAWSSDFSSNAPLQGTLGGSASASNGVLQLTTTNINQNGQLIIPSPGRPLRALHAEFDLLIGGGNIGEGFSFNYASNATNTATSAAEGFGNGLSILVDTFNNGGEAVPNIGIKNGGVILGEQVIPAVRNNSFNRFIIDVSASGLLTLKFNGTTVTNLSLGSWEPLPEWQFSLGARTTTARDNHFVDNLLIGERASGVLLPINPPKVTLALRPAFVDFSNVVYAVASNSNPALVTGSVAPHGTATLMTISNVVGTATVSFGGTNAGMDALVTFTVTTAQPEITSVAAFGGLAQLQLSGPPAARFYLQQSAAPTATNWTTIATGVLNGAGTGSVSGLPFSLGNMRVYRVLFTR